MESLVLSTQGQKVTSEQLGNKRLFLATKQRGPEVGGRKWGGAGEEGGQKGSSGGRGTASRQQTGTTWLQAVLRGRGRERERERERQSLPRGQRLWAGRGKLCNDINPAFPGLEKSEGEREKGRGDEKSFSK